MKISVCMATYNGAKYLKEQVDSILDQEFKENPDTELELIVSDDESTDDTIKLLQNYNDDRIKIYTHTEHIKHHYFNAAFACTKNFENAIKQAQGDFIFLSDQDDVWYPLKIDKTLTVLKKYGGVVGASFDVGDINLNKIGTLIYKQQPFFKLRLTHSLYGFSCGFAKEELKYILPIPNVPQHDTFIMLSAQWRGKLHYINDVCAMHRWSDIHNVSSAANNSQAPVLVKLYYRCIIWATVIWRVLKARY